MNLKKFIDEKVWEKDTRISQHKALGYVKHDSFLEILMKKHGLIVAGTEKIPYEDPLSDIYDVVVFIKDEKAAYVIYGIILENSKEIYLDFSACYFRAKL